jgi:hypothetical protein
MPVLAAQTSRLAIPDNPENTSQIETIHVIASSVDIQFLGIRLHNLGAASNSSDSFASVSEKFPIDSFLENVPETMIANSQN